MTAYRLTGEAKIAGCLNFIEILLEAGCKFLLFAYHISVLDAYEQYLQKKQKTSKMSCFYVRIDGSVPPEQRHIAVNQF